MQNRIIRSHKTVMRAASMAAALLMVATAAQAQHNDHGHKDKGKDKGKVVVVQRANGDVVAIPRHDVVVRKVPPGLAKKPGMMPPGQYKKLYTTSQGADVLSSVFRRHGYTVTRVVPSGNSRYVYYRLRNGQVQRAIIRPGTDRLNFDNVPSSLLAQVLSRLY